MTPTIQISMLVIAAIILLACKVKVSDVTSGSVFKSGMIAVISVYGVAWMAETYFGAYIPQFKTTLSGIVVAHPWTYAFVLFLISKLVNSQAAALAIVMLTLFYQHTHLTLHVLVLTVLARHALVNS